MDYNYKNFAYSLVATAPSPADSGTSLVVTAGTGTKFPTVPFYATVWPAGEMPSTTNAEIVLVTLVSTDTFTITREQESTSARTIVVGDQIANTITADTLNEIKNVPHLMQSDSTDQSIADINSAQVITFDTDVHHHGITRTSSSRFTITKAGSYLIAFSGVAVGATSKEIDMWLRVNDDDVAGSNTIYFFKTTGVGGIVAVTFIQHFNVGDYFEFWTWGDSTACKWDAIAAGVSPTRPACPSIIITANFVSGD